MNTEPETENGETQEDSLDRIAGAVEEPNNSMREILGVFAVAVVCGMIYLTIIYLTLK